jgi:hypothetical protein
MYLPWNQYQDGPAKTVGAIASEAMSAIALVAIAVGNNAGNSGSSGSSGGNVGCGGCGDKDIGSHSDGGGHRQQSTKDSSGRNGGGDLGCLFLLQESSGFLFFPLLWRFFTGITIKSSERHQEICLYGAYVESYVGYRFV